MAETNIPYGSPQAVRIQSAGLFAATMQRPTTLNRLTGKLPQQSDAESNLRFQSGNELPIVRCMDLSKGAGDEVDFEVHAGTLAQGAECGVLDGMGNQVDAGFAASRGVLDLVDRQAHPVDGDGALVG